MLCLLFSYISKQTRCIVFTYRFIKDNFVVNGVCSFRRLKRELNKIGKLEFYHNFCNKFQVFIPESKKKIYICVLNYQFDNSCFPKIYQFGKSFKMRFDINFMMGSPDDFTVFNEQYSNGIIKDIVNWSVLLNRIVDNLPLNNNLYVLLINVNKNRSDYSAINLDQYIHVLESSLIANDAIELIECEHAKQDLIIVNVVNNLKDYFLLAHHDKIIYFR